MRPRAPSRGLRTLPKSLVPTLLEWFSDHRRPLPWRSDRDPYRVWVAEVLLQQTRVAQATPYFDRFLRAFPTVEALAAAPLDKVLKAWQGAGYYARARHLRVAARQVVKEWGGQLPRTVEALESLPGVGPYTARAIAALAFDVPTVALEANGLRVAARWTREEGDLRARGTRRRLERVLFPALGEASPASFNEALMELGETVCLPLGPRCEVCPVAFACRARQELEDPASIPRRRAATPRPHVRAAVVVLIDRNGRWLVQRRAPSGLLGGLWEFPGGKFKPGESAELAARRELREETGAHVRHLESVGRVHHAYSHFTVELHVYRGRPSPPFPRPRNGLKWVRPEELLRLAIPKATEKVVRLLRETGAGRASRG